MKVRMGHNRNIAGLFAQISVVLRGHTMLTFEDDYHMREKDKYNFFITLHSTGRNE